MPSRALRLWFCLLSAIWFASFSPARAQTPTPTPAPLQMALSSPFARTQKPLSITGRSGKWVPLAVTLSNTGEPVTGQLQLQLSTGSPGGSFDYPSNTVSTSVEMPTNSRKVVWLYARLDRPDVGGFNVSFSGRGINVPPQLVPVTQPDSEQREVMIVSDTDIGLNDTLRSLKSQAVFRGGQAPSNPSGAGQSPVIPFAFGRADVPDRWIGFESANLVVLGDFPHSALSPQQIEALRGYVQGGGTLVVMGGANAARLASSPLKDLWPIRPTTSVPASFPEVAALVSHYVPNAQNGGDRLGGAPVVVTRGQLSPDAALEEGSPASPLFARRDVGAGRVLFLAYDPSQPPFKGWSGQGKLWSDLLLLRAQVRTLETVDADFLSFSNGGMVPNRPYASSVYAQDAPTSLTGQLLDAVSKAPQLRMPPVSRIAWFLALYVFFLVPLNYAVLRIIDRRELAWVTIPIIVVAFSVWAYTEALSIRGRAILTRQMDIVQSTVGSNSGRVDTLFWLFSPRTTSYAISGGGQNAALDDFANKSGGEQGAFTIEQPLDGGGFQLNDAPLRIWTDRAFASQSLGELGKGVSFQGQSLSNNTGTDLLGAVWVQGGRVTGLGPLKSGASVAIQRAKGQPYGADILGEIVRQSKLEDVFDSSSIANGIPHNALAAALGDDFGKLNSTPMLLAWGQRSIAPFSIGLQGAQGREMTLFVFRAPEEVLPPTLRSRQATVQRVAFDPFTPGISPAQVGYALFDCDVPASSSLTLRARGTGIRSPRAYPRSGVYPPSYPSPVRSGQVRVEAWDASAGKWQQLQGKTRFDPSPARGWNFSAKLPTNWVRRPANSLRVRVRLDNPGAQVSSLRVED